MKYIWIVMLGIVEIIWLIFSLIDIIYTAKHWKPQYIFEWLEGYTIYL